MGILDQYYRINRAAGIGLVIQRDGSAVADVCQCAVESRQLSFEKKFTGVHISELDVKINKDIPASVNISGKGVLYKRLERIEAVTSVTFGQVLPNAAMDDFYIQHFPSGQYSFIAVIRKDEADKWLQAITNQGIRVLSLSLGPFPVQHVIPQLNIYDQEVVFQGVKIERFADNSWEKIAFNEEFQAPYAIKIENEPLDQSLLAPYATAFQLLLADKLVAIKVVAPGLDAKFAEVTETQKFRVNAFLILIVFFVGLLGNFVWLSALRSENAKLLDNVTTSSQTMADLQNNEDQIRQKELLLKELGWDGGLKKSAMIDQVAALMPAEIKLREIAVNPPDLNAQRGTDKLKFQDRIMLIRGESGQVIPVNEWVARLKTTKWAKQVELVSYNFNNELNTGIFTITLTF